VATKTLYRTRQWDPILIAALGGSTTALTRLFRQAHNGKGACGLVPKLAWPLAERLGVPEGQQLQFVENVAQEVALQLVIPGRAGFDPKRASAVTYLRTIANRCALAARQELKVVGRRRPVAAASRAAEENARVRCLAIQEGGREALQYEAADEIRLLEIKHDASVVRESAPRLVARYYDARYDRGLTQREAAAEFSQPRSTLLREVAAYEEGVRLAHAG
jgi:hypothetical protein